MSDAITREHDIPAEINFSKGVRGLHHIPTQSQHFIPVSIERAVWEYFAGKARERGVDISELTEILQRDMEMVEA